MTGTSLQTPTVSSHALISHPNGSNSTILDQLMPIEFYARLVHPERRLERRTSADGSIRGLTVNEPATS